MRTASALLLVVACGSPAPSPATAPATAPALASASAVSVPAGPEPAGSASPPASSSAPSPDVPTPPPPSGPLAWKDFPGPDVAVAISGDRAWAVIPIGDDWKGSLMFSITDHKGTQGNSHLFQIGQKSILVPGAFARALTPAAGLAKGTPVFSGQGASSAYGRVLEVTGDSVKIKYEFGGSNDERTQDKSEVIKLDGKIGFAAPVGYKDGSEWEFGQVISAGKDKAWVLGFAGKPSQVDVKAMKALNVARVYKKGDAVVAHRLSQLRPAKVTDVVEGGLRYKVKFDEDGKEDTVTFDGVSASL